ncbi:hypothetical protein C5167_041769 [Papaver somniferum]|nr:hypothetical protein C5167_041769 [Papaver somniferum]
MKTATKYKRGYTLRSKHQQLTPLHHQKHASTKFPNQLSLPGINEKCPNALSMLGSLELQNDDLVEAKDTFQAAKKASDGNDSYAILSLVHKFSRRCVSGALF